MLHHGIHILDQIIYIIKDIYERRCHRFPSHYDAKGEGDVFIAGDRAGPAPFRGEFKGMGAAAYIDNPLNFG